MPITVPPDLEASIRQKVEAGLYRDAGAVMREALRLLEARDERLERLRAKVKIGLDQLDRGEGIPYTPELLGEIEREVEERLRRGDEPSPDVCP